MEIDSIYNNRRMGIITIPQRVLETNYELCRKIFKEFDFVWNIDHCLQHEHIEICAISNRFEYVSDGCVTPHYEVVVTDILEYNPATGEDERTGYKLKFELKDK